MWINASKCWPPAGPVKWMDMITPHATHPSGVRAVRLTHFVPAGDVLSYGQPPPSILYIQKSYSYITIKR